MYEGPISAGGGGNEPQATFMQRIDAISATNFYALIDGLWQVAFKQPIPVEARFVTDALITGEAIDRGRVTSARLNELVQQVLECSRPTAYEKIKIACYKKVISRKKIGKNVYYYFTPKQQQLHRQIRQQMRLVPQVIEKQLENPFDATAGITLLPKGSYFNVIVRFPESLK